MIRRALLYLFLCAVSALALFPFAWGLSISLKTEYFVIAYPPQWIPCSLTLSNYRHILTAGFPLYTINTVIVALMAIVIAVAVGFHSACGVRDQFRGRRTYLLVILCTMMIPGIGLLVPQYLMAAHLGLLNNLGALALIYAAIQAPMVVWLLTGFVRSVPRELEKSAWLDGCSRLRALYSIILPLIRAGVAVAALVVFVYALNEFTITSTLTVKPSKRLLSPGLYALVSAFGIEWGPFMIGVILAVLPAVVLFLEPNGRLGK